MSSPPRHEGLIFHSLCFKWNAGQGIGFFQEKLLQFRCGAKQTWFNKGFAAVSSNAAAQTTSKPRRTERPLLSDVACVFCLKQNTPLALFAFKQSVRRQKVRDKNSNNKPFSSINGNLFAVILYSIFYLQLGTSWTFFNSCSALKIKYLSINTI